MMSGVAEICRDSPSSVGPATAGTAALAWARWEDAVSRPGLGPATESASGAAPQALIDKYRVQAHYLEHRCFLGETVLLQQAARLAGLPVQLVHGRLDWVCRPGNAWQAQRAIPGSTLAWVDHGGHSPYDPPMLAALAEAIRRIQDSIAR